MSVFFNERSLPFFVRVFALEPAHIGNFAMLFPFTSIIFRSRTNKKFKRLYPIYWDYKTSRCQQIFDGKCYLDLWRSEHSIFLRKCMLSSGRIVSCTLKIIMARLKLEQETLCRIRSHGTELITLERKLHCGTFKTKESRAGLVRVLLFGTSSY